MATIPDFPSNNAKATASIQKQPQQAQNQPAQRPKVEPVVKNKVHTKKRTAKTIMQAIFVPQDVASVRDYIIFDIVIPKAKTVMADLGNSILNAILFGDAGPSRTTPYGQGSGVQRVSYNSYSSSRPASQQGRVTYGSNQHRPSQNDPRNRAIFEDVIFDSKPDADAVLAKLTEMIDMYGVVSVNDAYDACDLSAPYTYNNYGWTSLSSAYVDRNRHGEWVIHFPLALPID